MEFPERAGKDDEQAAAARRLIAEAGAVVATMLPYRRGR